jgi:hypothetical protein
MFLFVKTVFGGLDPTQKLIVYFKEGRSAQA